MSVDNDAIVRAVSGLSLKGNEDGLIPAFGLYLTRHFAGYYNRVSFAYLHHAEREGRMDTARGSLIEAGHICAFNTFGGIMLSQEWEAVVAPMIEQREDWVRGIVGVVNALGWGVWQIDALEGGERLEVSISNSYESTGYLRDFGTREKERGGVCFLATGGVAGIMNLLYFGDITARPGLNEDYYSKLFEAPGRFVAEEIECRAHGAPRCRFVARSGRERAR